MAFLEPRFILVDSASLTALIGPPYQVHCTYWPAVPGPLHLLARWIVYRNADIAEMLKLHSSNLIQMKASANPNRCSSL